MTSRFREPSSMGDPLKKEIGDHLGVEMRARVPADLAAAVATGLRRSGQLCDR